jgi:ATP-dependent DNA helicase RecQ
MNSAQRVSAVARRFRLEGQVPAGPVLLVDDQTATGWTLTLAARALREAGATAVLPLTLAVRA